MNPAVIRFLKIKYPKRTYRHHLKIFLKRKSKTCSPHTVARLYYNLKPLGDHKNNPKTKTIKARQLKSYIQGLWARYAPDTIRGIVGDIKALFRWLKRKGYLKKNPAKKIQSVQQKHRPGRNRTAKETNIHLLIRHLVQELHNIIYRDLFGNLIIDLPRIADKQQKLLRDLFIVVFLYETGARAGELSNLATRTMNQAQQLSEGIYQITMYGKTNDEDRYFTEKTAEIWRLWHQFRPQEKAEYAIIGWSRRHKHDQLLSNGISQIIYRRCQQFNIPPFRANALRHAKIKRGRKAIGIELTSKLMGHSSITMTRQYDFIDDDEIAHAARESGLQTDIWR